MSTNTKESECLHVAFADETNHTAASGQYGAIALLTLSRENAKRIHDKLILYQKEHGITEFKWQKTGNSKYNKMAKVLIDVVIEEICKENLRIDILSWDYLDSRHNRKGRDEIANLHRMYHHLLKNVFTHKWPDNINWKFCPDENSAINWPDVRHFLWNKSTSNEYVHDLFTEPSYNWRNLFHLTEINELDSKSTPLIQIADLFAGLSAYSRKHYLKYNQWKEEQNGVQYLFGTENNAKESLSKNDISRCQIIDHLKENCTKHKLGVSFKSSCGFKTHAPSKPINFWWYEPQHESDKIPLKKK